jgi:hypothetical protein
MTRNAPSAIRPAVSGGDRTRPPHDVERRSTAFDLAFNDVFRNIAQKGRGTTTPFLAVLGPTGSGKSLLLSRLAEYLDQRSPPDTYCHITVDLRRPLADLDQMHFDLVKAVYAQAQGHGSSIQLQISRENARYTFVSHMRDILQSIDKCVMIYVDHSDYVPRYFARSLATQFRDILEKEDLYTELRRVGFVWSGAMSLFGLKQEVDSAFSMCKTVVTPFTSHEQRKLLTCEQLERGGFVAPSELIVDYLAEQTGGEPAFLDPIIRLLRDDSKKGRLSKAPLQKLMKQLGDPTRTAIPELKEIALNVHLDHDLREIVDRLLNGSIAPCREPSVDVDQYHLKGAVILDRGTSRMGYSFRNGLVEQFLRNLLSQPAVRQVRLAEQHEDGVLTFPGPLSKIRELRTLEERLQECFDLREATALIVDAWSTLTVCGKPTIAFCVRGRKIIWFSPTRGEPTDRAPFPATEAAAAGTFSCGRTYFGFDEDRVSVAIPLQYGTNSAALTATVERSKLQVGLSEMSVHYWAQFVTSFEARLTTLCMSTLGMQRIAETMQGPARSGADAHSNHMEASPYVLCFAYDCRGNPLADAAITFELVDGGVRTPLGEVRTVADRARPVSVIAPLRVDKKSRIEVRGSYTGQTSKPIEVDAKTCWSCEFIFHIDDGEEAWTSMKRRTRWRCRHPNKKPECRAVQAPADGTVFAITAASASSVGRTHEVS